MVDFGKPLLVEAVVVDTMAEAVAETTVVAPGLMEAAEAAEDHRWYHRVELVLLQIIQAMVMLQ
jgi:hypothetical protein